MNRKKEGVKTITFDIGPELKAKLERYCTRKHLTLAEALRCYVVNLPEEEGLEENALAEIIAIRDRLQKKIDSLS